MLTVITWLWEGNRWRNCYTAQHVNAMHRMVKRHLRIPHQFKCFTNMPKGIECETIPIDWEVKTSTPEHKPNCYRRLKVFDPDMRKVLGDRFIHIDLDAVILDDITPIVDRPQDDFIIMKGEASVYNGSMWMMDTGCRAKVWKDFRPESSPQRVRQLSQQKNTPRLYGSDQAWISAKLPSEKVWLEKDGVYQYRLHIDKKDVTIPDDARIVFFAGSDKPWHKQGFVKLASEYNQYL